MSSHVGNDARSAARECATGETPLKIPVAPLFSQVAERNH
jgi:hypothetical protein